MKHILSLENKSILVQALVFSILNYEFIILASNCSNKETSSFDQMIRHAARFVLVKTKHESITEHISNELEWLFTEQKIIHDNIPLA